MAAAAAALNMYTTGQFSVSNKASYDSSVAIVKACLNNSLPILLTFASLSVRVFVRASMLPSLS